MKRLCCLFFCIFIANQVSAKTNNIEVIRVPEDSRSSPPAIHFTEDGTLWTAWPSYQSGRLRLATAFRSQGEWSDIFYPVSSTQDLLAPLWIPRRDNVPDLVYTVFDGKEEKVCRITRRNKKWTAPKVLGVGANPAVTVAGDAIWIAWENDTGIIVLNIDSSGNQTAAPTQNVIRPEGAGNSFSHPALASGPEGAIWLAWDAARIGYQSVLLQRIDKPDCPQIVVDDGGGINREPRISLDSVGRVWIVYEELMPLGEYATKPKNKDHWPTYIYDRTYLVNPPSLAVRVTDGKKWWRPETSTDAAPGLVPNLLCTRDGSFWLVSRRVADYTPLCENLGSQGWKNFATAWVDRTSYKAVLPLAEDPQGQVWTAWAQHERKRISSRKTPSWTFLDGLDAIYVAAMPDSDISGIPRLRPWKKPALIVSEPYNFPTYRADYKGDELQVFFGDLHIHSEFSGCGRLNSRIDQGQHYSRFVRGLDFMCTTDHAEHLNDFDWYMTQKTAARNYSPGAFVTFTGFEWTSEFDAGGNLYRGHYNPLFRDVGQGDYFYSASDPDFNTPLKLWQALKKAVGGAQNVLTIPHHISRRMAWISWNYYDPEMVPLLEIVQSRGSYEYEGSFSQQPSQGDRARVRGHFAKDGLERNMRWGFAGGGDHGGRQLTAVYSRNLERGEIFDALKSRKAYATNGARIFLDVRLNRHFMGEEFRCEGRERKLTITAKGDAPLIQIDLFRNGRQIRQWNMSEKEHALDWVDEEPLDKRENSYYVRVRQADGGLAWSSPIWLINTLVPGSFQFQIGGDELRVIYPDQETDIAVLMHNETDNPVSGRVGLSMPPGWKVKERDGITVQCAPGEWCHAVFHVTVPGEHMSSWELPDISTEFIPDSGKPLNSRLFVLASKEPVTREQKAVLIDARTEIPHELFNEYVKKMMELWRSDNKE